MQILSYKCAISWSFLTASMIIVQKDDFEVSWVRTGNSFRERNLFIKVWILEWLVLAGAVCILCPKIICLSEKDLFCQIFSEFYICSDFCDPSINLFSPLSPTEQPIDLDGGNSAQKGYFAKWLVLVEQIVILKHKI